MKVPEKAAAFIRTVAHENDKRVYELIQVAIASLDLAAPAEGKEWRYNIEAGEVCEQ